MDVGSHRAQMQGIIREIKEGLFNLPPEAMAVVLDIQESHLDSPRSLSQVGESLILLAATCGCVSLARQLLKVGIIPDCPTVSSPGMFPLHKAAVKGHHEVIQILVGAGADKDRVFFREPGLAAAPGKDGCTPLLAAAQAGRLEAVRVLIESGASLEKEDSQGGTPIFYAAERGHTEVVQVLAEAGAEVNPKKVWGWNPLSVAIKNGHLETVRVLVAKGSDLTRGLAVAITAGHEDIIRFLVESAGINVNVSDPGNQMTPLVMAAGRGRLGLVQLFLAAGADLSASDADGRTPLGEAARTGRTEIVVYVLQCGAQDPNLKVRPYCVLLCFTAVVVKIFHCSSLFG